MGLSRSALVLVAIFTSLTVGLLIGAAIGADQQLLARQEAWLAALEERFDGIRARQQELAEELEHTRDQAESHRQLAEELLLAVAAVQIGDRSLVIWPAEPKAVVPARSLTHYLSGAGVRTALVEGDLEALRRGEELGEAVETWQADGEGVFVVVLPEPNSAAVDTALAHEDARDLFRSAGLHETPIYVVQGAELWQRWSLLLALTGESDGAEP